jgi:hypothetical protein
MTESRSSLERNLLSQIAHSFLPRSACSRTLAASKPYSRRRPISTFSLSLSAESVLTC